MDSEMSQCVRSMRLMLHDLAQPLSVLAGTVDLLMMEVDPSSPQFHEVRHLSEQLQVILNKMEAIRRLARQMSTLVENVVSDESRQGLRLRSAETSPPNAADGRIVWPGAGPARPNPARD